MRIILTIGLALGLSALAKADEAPSPRYERAFFAGQMGHVSALALGANGTLYAADYNGGYIYRLTDRGRDGRLDSKRRIASGLIQPSGIAVIGERVFVSDKRAIWEIIPDTGGLRQVASLANANALAAPRPLTFQKNSGVLVIGLTNASKRGARLVSVDTNTGAAHLLSQGDYPLDVLASGIGETVWAASNAYILPVPQPTYTLKNGTEIEGGEKISGLVLPVQPDALPPALLPYADHIFAAVSYKSRANSPSSRTETRIYAVPTRFGHPIDGAVQIVGGIASRRATSTDAPPGAMVMDARGIFLADAGNETIWRIRKSPPKPKPESEPQAAIQLDQPASGVPAAVLDPKGSAISKGSLLDKGSTIDVGSTIPEVENDDQSKDEKEALAPDREK